MTLGTANANQVKLDSNTLSTTKDFIHICKVKVTFLLEIIRSRSFLWLHSLATKRGWMLGGLSTGAPTERGTIWRWELGPGDHPRRDQHQLTAFSPVVALKHVVANHMTLMSKSERFFGLFIFRNDNQAKRVQVK